ncbi:hypothetical protein F4803DRAFT_368262 [Xylaria telfairii]|nr:hypothetical protein F4803DRAFT_368262 [Xylaria telfairii]
MSANIAFKIGLTDPQTGFNLLLRILFGGEAELNEVLRELESLTNIEEPRSWLSGVISWVLFGPLLYVVVAPVYYVYAFVSSVAARVIPAGEAVVYAFIETRNLVRTGMHVFFLTGFALQALRICLTVLAVPPDALFMKYIEEALNIFLTISTLFSGWPRRVRQRPGRDNWVWLPFALIAAVYIWYDTSSWSPAWRLTTLHFVLFVGLAGPGKRKGVESPAVKHGKDIEIYQKQALLVASVLGLFFAATKTENWDFLFRLEILSAAVFMFIYAFNENTNVNAEIRYVDDPKDPRLEDPEYKMAATFWLMVNIIFSIMICLEIANWPWYYKWPLILIMSFLVFLHLGVLNLNTTPVIYAPRQSVPEYPQLIEHDDSDEELYNEVFGGADDTVFHGRLPFALQYIGPYPNQEDRALLYWYRYILEERISKRGLNKKQHQLVALQAYSLLEDQEEVIRASFRRRDILLPYIDQALESSRRYNPDFYEPE